MRYCQLIRYGCEICTRQGSNLQPYDPKSYPPSDGTFFQKQDHQGAPRKGHVGRPRKASASSYGKRAIRVLEKLSCTKLYRIVLIRRQRHHFVVGFEQMPETSQRPFAGVGVEHIRDSNICVSELARGSVNAVQRADLAAEFLS